MIGLKELIFFYEALHKQKVSNVEDLRLAEANACASSV